MRTVPHDTVTGTIIGTQPLLPFQSNMYMPITTLSVEWITNVQAILKLILEIMWLGVLVPVHKQERNKESDFIFMLMTPSSIFILPTKISPLLCID